MLKQTGHIILIVIGILCLSVSANVGPTSYPVNQGKRTVFAIGLFTGSHSSVPTYAFITFSGNSVVGSEVIREQRFMYSALGHWPSPANPDRVNLFEEYNVDSCFLLVDEDQRVNGYYCKPFADLWKIRFYESPYEYDTRGWSQGQYKPSRFQMEFLQKEYGVSNVLTDYFYGDSLFKLLRDVQSDVWVNKYKFVQDSTKSTP